MTINRIQLKVLLLDSITRLKYGSKNPLVATNKSPVRREFKQYANLAPNCPEEDVLTAIAATYEGAGKLQEFIDCMKRFKMEKWIQIA